MMNRRKCTTQGFVSILLMLLTAFTPNLEVLAMLPSLVVVEEEDLALTDLDLIVESTSDLGTWEEAPGSFADGFTLFLDPAEDYYLNVADLVVNGTLADDYHEFFIDTSDLPTDFYTYWEVERGVYEGCTGIWEPIMWEIITGVQPFFYLKVSDSGTVFKLVDGLKFFLYPGQDLPLFIDGSYWLGESRFIGTVEDTLERTDEVSVNITFMAYEELDVLNVSLTQSLDQLTWDPVDGNLSDGYLMLLDPTVEYYYLDAVDITANRTIKVGFYPFFIDVDNLPVGFYAYWENERGVYEGCPGTYEPVMWEIISGASPIFYLDVTETDFMLVDGLLYQLTAAKECLRINGDYWPGVYTFKGTLADEFGFTDDLEIEFTLDDLPLAYEQSLYVDEDGTLEVTLTGEDHFGVPLIFSIISNPSKGTLTGTPPDLTYTPKPDFDGSDSFTFTTSDGTNTSQVAIISININPVEDPPIAHDQSVEMEINTSKEITLVGTDADGDLLIYIITMFPTNGTLTIGGPVQSTVVYKPEEDYVGPDSFTFAVSDGKTTSEPATVDITVIDNRPPVADPQDVETNEDQAVEITLTGSDPDGDELRWRIIDQPIHGDLTINPALPYLIYTPNPDYYGSDYFVFRTMDGNQGSIPAQVDITIHPTPDPPVAYDQSLSTEFNTPLQITLVGTDVDDDELNFSIITNPSHGELTVDDTDSSIVTYSPHPDFHGPDSFTYQVSDGVYTDTAVISIEVKKQVYKYILPLIYN